MKLVTGWLFAAVSVGGCLRRVGAGVGSRGRISLAKRLQLLRRRRSTHERWRREADPVLALLAAAPVDDESVSLDDARYISEGRQAYTSGQTH